jgi:hypothetical protein
MVVLGGPGLQLKTPTSRPTRRRRPRGAILFTETRILFTETRILFTKNAIPFTETRILFIRLLVK